AASRRAAGPGRLPRLGVRLAAVGALATAAVVGVTVLQSGGVDEQGRPAPVVPGIPAGPVANASELLERAAQSAEARPFTPPRPDQWVYTESRSRRGDTPNGPLSDDPADTRTNRSWTRADGKVIALMENGRLEQVPLAAGTMPPSDYASLAKLPTDPDALLKWVYAGMGGLGETSEGRYSTAYGTLSAILRDNVLPPRLEAAVFRAIKKIPDVTLVEGRVDMAGRQAIALGRITEGYIHEEILFDPKTYRYLGERAVAIKDHSTRGEDGTLSFRKGDLMRLTVQVKTGIVDEAGQRP
ncbi:CU044_5270 family protein, partial [Actinomadura sediminis]